MSEKIKKLTNPFDKSIPGYTKLSGWPKEPAFPEQIKGICLYRDGGTVGVTIKGKNGKDIEFFFDRELGRLCYGKHHTHSDAAFIEVGTEFEKEVFSYLEAARKKLNTHIFCVSDIKMFNECFQKAKVYSGV